MFAVFLETGCPLSPHTHTTTIIYSHSDLNVYTSEFTYGPLGTGLAVSKCSCVIYGIKILESIYSVCIYSWSPCILCVCSLSVIHCSKFYSQSVSPFTVAVAIMSPIATSSSLLCPDQSPLLYWAICGHF